MPYPRIHSHMETRSQTQLQMKFLWSRSAVLSVEVRVSPSCPGPGCSPLWCGSASRTPQWWLTYKFGTSITARRTAQTFGFGFLTLGDWAEQNCMKAKKNTFTPSKTVRSALPVPYWGVTYSTSSIGPTYSSGMFLKVALLPFVNSNKEPA